MFLLETVSVPVLPMVWFLLATVLWLGYFFLEGFDYGVAMLIPILGKNDRDKRVIVNTIGPVWDGNEVWLLTAGGAIFAAFPHWYATLFSGFYLPLLLILVGLILRGVAFEYRSKHPDSRYRNMLDWFAIIGSFLPTLVFGVGFANFIIGLANDGLLWNGSFIGLFGPFALLGGVMLVVLFLVHGAAFIALKTKHEIHDRAESFGAKVGWVATALVALFVVCQNVFYPANSEFRELLGLRLDRWHLGDRLHRRRHLDAGPRPRRLGFHPHRLVGGHLVRRRLRQDVRQPGLQAGRDGRRHRALEHHHGSVVADDADHHDVGRGDLCPDRPGLPGVVVLGVLEAHQHEEHPEEVEAVA